MGFNLMEYLDPFNRRDYLAIQHIERYQFAASKLKPDMKVLDIASGFGYGTIMLLQKGCNVIGADYDSDAVSNAIRRWGYPNFIQADALDLPFDDEIFDAVVSFETIEHVNDGDRFLSEMKRVLKRGGIFICSTPNIRYTSHPQYHKKEYYPEEFYKLVKKYFHDVECYAQFIGYTDRIKDLVRWKLKPLIVQILEKIYLKEILKSFFKKALSNKEINNFSTLQQLHDIRPSKYCVKPLNLHSGLLRIMIAVGSKR